MAFKFCGFTFCQRGEYKGVIQQYHPRVIAFISLCRSQVDWVTYARPHTQLSGCMNEGAPSYHTPLQRYVPSFEFLAYGLLISQDLFHCIHLYSCMCVWCRCWWPSSHKTRAPSHRSGTCRWTKSHIYHNLASFPGPALFWGQGLGTRQHAVYMHCTQKCTSYR